MKKERHNFTYCLCEYGTWYFILREEHRLRGFENRGLRRIFGPGRGEIKRKQKRVTQLRYFYSIK
jgi:hypothetical protein